jgi:hypothetical protein
MTIYELMVIFILVIIVYLLLQMITPIQHNTVEKYFVPPNYVPRKSLASSLISMFLPPSDMKKGDICENLIDVGVVLDNHTKSLASGPFNSLTTMFKNKLLDNIKGVKVSITHSDLGTDIKILK